MGRPTPIAPLEHVPNRTRRTFDDQRIHLVAKQFDDHVDRSLTRLSACEFESDDPFVWRRCDRSKSCVESKVLTLRIDRGSQERESALRVQAPQEGSLPEKECDIPTAAIEPNGPEPVSP